MGPRSGDWEDSTAMHGATIGSEILGFGEAVWVRIARHQQSGSQRGKGAFSIDAFAPSSVQALQG